jgi:hypothetical protein
MAFKTSNGTQIDNEIEVNAFSLSNILWRWVGVRLVPHLPCSFDCQASEEIAKNMVKIGKEIGFEEEMDWIVEILSWPVEWSALHGIAEIKTPILKISTRTDAFPVPYVVRYLGGNYPEDGAKGLGFPYDSGKMTENATAKKIAVAEWERTKWYYEDNGFCSKRTMELAHKPIVKLITDEIEDHAANVIDFGCGNGALLKRITDANFNIVPYGIDYIPERIEHAQRLHTKYRQNFFVGDIFDGNVFSNLKDQKYVGVLMIGRLVKVDKSKSEKLRSFLKEKCDYVVVYAYDDWCSSVESFANLVAEVGLSLIHKDPNFKVGLAKW